MSDPFASFFFICFLIGLFYTGISFVLGMGHFTGHGLSNLFHSGHSLPGSHIHLGQTTHQPGHLESGQDHLSKGGYSPFNLATIMAFLTWFGAGGYVLRYYYHVSALIASLSALGAGFLGGLIIFLYLTKVIARLESPPLNQSDFDKTGLIGKITSGIREGGMGEVVFSQHGFRRVEAARSNDNTRIERGTTVVIRRYEKGIAYVMPLPENVLNESQDQKAV